MVSHELRLAARAIIMVAKLEYTSSNDLATLTLDLEEMPDGGLSEHLSIICEHHCYENVVLESFRAVFDAMITDADVEEWSQVFESEPGRWGGF